MSFFFIDLSCEFPGTNSEHKQSYGSHAAAAPEPGSLQREFFVLEHLCCFHGNPTKPATQAEREINEHNLKMVYELDKWLVLCQGAFSFDDFFGSLVEGIAPFPEANGDRVLEEGGDGAGALTLQFPEAPKLRPLFAETRKALGDLCFQVCIFCQIACGKVCSED